MEATIKTAQERIRPTIKASQEKMEAMMSGQEVKAQ
jgi:hypothetical protein